MAKVGRLHSLSRSGLVAALAFLSGCDAAAPYRSALRDQTKAIGDLEKILSTVTDQSSMRIARAKLADRFEDFESIRARAVKLTPPDRDIMTQVQEDGEKARTAMEKLLEQIRRVQGLPGGPEFLESFEGSRGLLPEQAPSK